MFSSKQSGSSSLAGVIGISALTFALFYAKGLVNKLGSTIREAKISNLSDDANIMNFSNLALLRGLLNPAKIAPSLYEPAVYADNYFAATWDLHKNDLTANLQIQAHGPKVNIKNFNRAASDMNQIREILASGSESKSLPEKKRFHELEIVRLNLHPSHPYYIASVDVKTIAEVTEKSGSSNLQRKVEALGRIELVPPSPNGIELQIRSEGGGSWTNNFGSSTAPIPAGKYQLRLLGGGVVYTGQIESSTGMKITLGLKDNGIAHSANNIHRKDIEIGVTDPLQFGENKTFVVEMDPISNMVNIGVPGENGSITDPKVGYNSGTCRFSSGPPSPALPSTPVTVETTEESTSESSTTTLVPGEMMLSASLTGVDGSIYEKTLSQKVYVLNKITTKRIQKTVTITKATPVSKGGDDGQQCASYCPRSTADATGSDQWNVMWPYASRGDAVSSKMRDFVEHNNGYNGLPITGVSCVNYDLTAQKIMQLTGAPGVDAIKNANNGAWWAVFDQQWGGGGAKNLERYVAYVLPSCQRQIVGQRDACGCFDENTLILMADRSERPVREIRSGDLVWNPKSNRSQAVKRVIAGPEKAPMIRLEFEDRSVTVTSQHPFLSLAGLMAAKDLKAGDVIISEQGQQTIAGITRVEANSEDLPVVWNFELEGDEKEDDHYVMANGVMTGDLFLQIKLESKRLGSP